MGDKTIKRTIVTEWVDRMTATIRKSKKEFDKLARSGDKVEKGQRDVEKEVKKTGKSYDRMGNQAKKAHKKSIDGSKRAKTQIDLLGRGAGKLKGAFAAAFSIAVLTAFTRQIVGIVDQIAELERVGRRLTLSQPGGVGDEPAGLSGETFERSVEKLDSVLKAEGGSTARDFFGALDEFVRKGLLDTTAEDFGQQIERQVLALAAAREQGADPSSFAQGVSAFSGATGLSAVESIEQLMLAARESTTPIGELADFVGRVAEATKGFASGQQLLGLLGGGVKISGKSGRDVKSALEGVLLERQAAKTEGRPSRFTGTFEEQVVQSLIKMGKLFESQGDEFVAAAQAGTAQLEAGEAVGISDEVLQRSGLGVGLGTNIVREFGDAWRDGVKVFEKRTETMVDIWERDGVGGITAMWAAWFARNQSLTPVEVFQQEVTPLGAEFVVRRDVQAASVEASRRESEARAAERQERLAGSMDRLADATEKQVEQGAGVKPGKEMLIIATTEARAR